MLSFFLFLAVLGVPFTYFIASKNINAPHTEQPNMLDCHDNEDDKNYDDEFYYSYNHLHLLFPDLAEKIRCLSLSDLDYLSELLYKFETTTKGYRVLNSHDYELTPLKHVLFETVCDDRIKLSSFTKSEIMKYSLSDSSSLKNLRKDDLITAVLSNPSDDLPTLLDNTYVIRLLPRYAPYVKDIRRCTRCAMYM